MKSAYFLGCAAAKASFTADFVQNSYQARLYHLIFTVAHRPENMPLANDMAIVALLTEISTLEIAERPIADFFDLFTIGTAAAPGKRSSTPKP